MATGASQVPSWMSDQVFPTLSRDRPLSSEPRFLRIKPTDGSSLKDVSPFLLTRTIESCAGKMLQAWMNNRVGEFCVQVQNRTCENKLLKLTRVDTGSSSIPVQVKSYDNLNQSKIVISCQQLIDSDEEEILQELKDQNVVAVYRIKRKEKENLVNTPALVLTVDSKCPPEYIKLGWMKCRTRKYYPRPTRCFTCLQFGHISAECKADKICQNCAGPFHEKCNQPAKCACCQEDHPTLSNECSKMKEEQLIVKVKIDRNISFLEARRITKEQQKQPETYATATKNNDNSNYLMLLKRMERLEHIVSEQSRLLEEKDRIIEDQKTTIKNLKEELQKLNTPTTTRSPTDDASSINMKRKAISTTSDEKQNLLKNKKITSQEELVYIPETATSGESVSDDTAEMSEDFLSEDDPFENDLFKESPPKGNEVAVHQKAYRTLESDGPLGSTNST
ncbi:uncharacterized protein LOC129759678 [Uranotaenia lowii]|uniref:uncharacterized protein LOC129742441 n=1 Tax=Uranotaenia lowii TaxID=190385 RepID=UPI002479272E|nr:uncharacterized protein LOC129742441 [Uranotaenia lowii]XP_055613165.1 uncharacterized protein LOC129759678 [Uranotaenia lowii]